jgi:hypothetical protein
MAMTVTGKSISIEQACDALEKGKVTQEVKAGELTAKWVEASDGTTTILVMGLGDQILQLK